MSSEQSFHFITGLKNSPHHKNDNMNDSNLTFEIISIPNDSDSEQKIRDGGLPRYGDYSIFQYLHFTCEQLDFRFTIETHKLNKIRKNHLIARVLNELAHNYHCFNKYKDYDDLWQYCLKNSIRNTVDRHDFVFFDMNREKISKILAHFKFDFRGRPFFTEFSVNELTGAIEAEYHNGC
jgi:hypothetical protein